MSGRRERRSTSKSSKNKKDKKNDVPIKAEEEARAEDNAEVDAVDEESSPSSTNNDTKKTRKVKESVIDHTYRDYSLVEVADEGEVPNVTGGEDGAPPTARAASSGVDSSTGKHSNFPAKLHAILSNPGYQHIICWMVSSINLSVGVIDFTISSLSLFIPFVTSFSLNIQSTHQTHTSPMEGVGILL